MPNTDLRPYLSIKTGGSVSSLAILKSKQDIEKFVLENNKFLILGGGTNTIFRDGEHDLSVGIMQIPGYEKLEENDDYTLIQIGGGEDWDSVVGRTIEENLQGIEALSGIPGTAGAAPIQNIGAYGSELKDVLVSLEAYDVNNKVWRTLNNSECDFEYRDSLFRKNPGHYVITSITLRLHKSDIAPVPDYKDVKKVFENTSPTTHQVRDAILKIRASKLPDPKLIPNCGSFFKNPIVSKKKAAEIPNSPQYPAGEKVKLSAGWLIQECGFKGRKFGHVGVYDNNALVLTTDCKASTEELLTVAKNIQNAVYEKFGVNLEMEPQIV